MVKTKITVSVEKPVVENAKLALLKKGRTLSDYIEKSLLSLSTAEDCEVHTFASVLPSSLTVRTVLLELITKFWLLSSHESCAFVGISALFANGQNKSHVHHAEVPQSSRNNFDYINSIFPIRVEIRIKDGDISIDSARCQEVHQFSKMTTFKASFIRTINSRYNAWIQNIKINMKAKGLIIYKEKHINLTS